VDKLVCVGVFFAIIAFSLIIFAVGAYFEKKRREALSAVAEELAFQFRPNGDAELNQLLSGFELFNLGHSRRMTNLLQGKTSDLELNLFDYQYTTGSGKNRTTRTYSIFVARRPGMKLPEFSLAPENFLHKIGSLFGFQDIDFDSHPRFSSRYLLRGSDEEAIRTLFKPKVLDWFEEHGGLTIEAKRDLVVFYKSPRISPTQIRNFMAEGFEVLKVFDDAAAT
jgi:hypothetical protein